MIGKRERKWCIREKSGEMHSNAVTQRFEQVIAEKSVAYSVHKGSSDFGPDDNGDFRRGEVSGSQRETKSCQSQMGKGLARF